MKIGFDYWNVISTHPDYFRALAWLYLDAGDEVHVISAIGPGRAGTVAGDVAALGIPVTRVHEVVFGHPRESPWRKTDLAVRLGLDAFYDDRDDVCEAMTDSGILAFRVTRPFRRRPGGPRTARQATPGDRHREDIAAERGLSPSGG